MNRERLFKHLEDHYIPKREMISRIPLGVQPDEFWQDVLNRRRARSISLPLHNSRGIPYWYVVTGKMISASEQIVSEMMDNETEFDPYKDTPAASSLEESFFTSYVEGSQLSLQDAMEFLQGEREPQEPEEQMIINNRNALSFAGANLFRPVDEDYIRTLAYILTENMDGGGQEYRLDDCPPIPSMMGIPYELPTAAALQDRVNEICMLIHDPTIHPLIKSGVAQAWVLVTRPFPEGNERLGRLLSQVILFRAGYVFFSEISLSSLIARTSYAYFNAITNILLPENGADLTYFLEYYMTLLAKAVEERHLRIRQRETQELQAEQAMAQMPLAPPPQEDTSESRAPLLESDSPGESKQDEGGDEKSKQYNNVRAKLEEMSNGQSERQMACAAYLTECLSREKFTLDIFDISENMKLDMDSAGNLITHLKMKGILKSLQRRGRAMLYAFCEDNASNRPTMKRDAFRRKLTDYCKDTKSTIGKAMNILLGFLDQGKNTFSSTELQVSLGLTSVQLKSLCHNIKDKGLTKLIGYENDRPMYALAFEENDAADVAPVKASFRPQTVKHEYSQEVLDRIDELNASTRSPKDRRIGGMLKMHLNRGKVTEVDYINAGYKTHWAKDMKLAEQIGLVKKFNQGCYTIVSDIKPGPSPLNNNQKEIVSAMYQSFGNEAFSSEMVIATLDYTSAHVSAVLHQFTLMKILNCSSDAENKYQYKLTVNPERNPECFVGVA